MGDQDEVLTSARAQPTGEQPTGRGDDDVEGHIPTAAQPTAAQPTARQPIAKSDDDDVEGHELTP